MERLAKILDFIEKGGIWFILSAIFQSFSTIILFIIYHNFNDSVVIIFLDFFLLVLVYVFLYLANKIDHLLIYDLKEKFNYVDLPKLNDLGFLKVLLFHLIYIIIFLYKPLVGFLIVLPIPLLLSLYRAKMSNKVFPMF